MDKEKEIQQILIDLPLAFRKLHRTDGKASYTDDSTKSTNNTFVKSLVKDFDQIFKLDKEKIKARTFLDLLLYTKKSNPSDNTIFTIQNYINGINNGTIYMENDECFYDPSRVENTTKSKKKEKLAYVFGFLFFFIPYVSLPISSIGLYKTKKEYYSKKRRKIRFCMFGIMLFLSSIGSIVLNAVYTYKVSNEMFRLEQMDRQSLQPSLQETFLNVHNVSKHGKGYRYNKYNEEAETGDTLKLAIVLFNQGFIKIPNVKVKLFNRKTVPALKNTLFCSIATENFSGFQNSVTVSIPKNCFLEITGDAFWAINNKINDKIPFNQKEFNQLFGNGFKIPFLEPLDKNMQVIYVDYVVKKVHEK